MLFSIIMPVYHPDLPYMEKAAASCLNQEEQDFELVMVDDGSGDPWWEMFHVDDPRIRIIKEPHRGVSAARNTGIRAAEGDYVLFLDADDVLYPWCLKILKEEILRCGTDAPSVILKTFEVRRPGDPVLAMHKPCKAVMEARPEQILSGVINHKKKVHGIIGNTNELVLRREFLRQSGIEFNESLAYGEDSEMMFHVLRYADPLCLTGCIMGGYTENPVSVTKKYSPGVDEKMLRKVETITAYQDIYPNIPQEDFAVYALRSYIDTLYLYPDTNRKAWLSLTERYRPYIKNTSLWYYFCQRKLYVPLIISAWSLRFRGLSRKIAVWIRTH